MGESWDLVAGENLRYRRTTRTPGPCGRPSAIAVQAPRPRSPLLYSVSYCADSRRPLHWLLPLPVICPSIICILPYSFRPDPRGSDECSPNHSVGTASQRPAKEDICWRLMWRLKATRSAITRDTALWRASGRVEWLERPERFSQRRRQVFACDGSRSTPVPRIVWKIVWESNAIRYQS